MESGKPELMTWLQRQVSVEHGKTVVAPQNTMYDTAAVKQAWDIDAVNTQAFRRVLNAQAPRLFISSPPLTGGVLNRAAPKTLTVESDDEGMPGLLEESDSESDRVA